MYGAPSHEVVLSHPVERVGEDCVAAMARTTCPRSPCYCTGALCRLCARTWCRRKTDTGRSLSWELFHLSSRSYSSPPLQTKQVERDRVCARQPRLGSIFPVPGFRSAGQLIEVSSRLRICLRSRRRIPAARAGPRHRTALVRTGSGWPSMVLEAGQERAVRGDSAADGEILRGHRWSRTCRIRTERSLRAV